MRDGRAPARSASPAARAHAIDGRRMDVQGSTVVTPLGSTLQGRYGRRDFAYRVPVGRLTRIRPSPCGSAAGRRSTSGAASPLADPRSGSDARRSV